MSNYGNSPSRQRVLKRIFVVSLGTLASLPEPTPVQESLIDENGDDVVHFGTVAQDYLPTQTSRTTAALRSHGMRERL